MASLTKIHIQNFRIHKDTNIFADGNNIGNLLVLVGKNDIGKSSILKALDVFFNEQEVTSNDFYQENEEDIVLGCQIANKMIRKVFKRNGNNEVIDNETDLPIFLYFDISNQSVFSEIEEYTIDDIILIVENQIKRYIKYNMDYDQDYIEERYQDIPIEGYAEELLYKWKELLEDFNQNSKHIPIGHRGAGVKKICALYYHIMQSMMRTNEIDYVFAIDEPELSLHPAQQRKMMQILKKISENKEWENIQIIIATHSPYIVNEVNTKDIFILKHKVDANGNALPEIEPHPLDASVLKTYNSLAEINYLAFDEPSIEYHIELFGFIHNKLVYKLENDNSFKTYWNTTMVKPNKNGVLKPVPVKIKGVDVWFEKCCAAKKYNWFETDNYVEEQRTLPYCVRNNIDHPLKIEEPNKINGHRAFVNNNKYNKEWIVKKSIDIMREAIINNPNIFA